MSKPATTGTSSLARGLQIERRPWHEPDWQRLWLATQLKEKTWRSLALVPAGRGLPARFIEKSAVSLSRTGMTHLGQSIHVADATRVQLPDLNEFFAELAHCTSNGVDRVVIALAPVSENVTSVSIVQQCDCALLCVMRGLTDASEAKRTVQAIGTKHFIGSVMFDGLL